MNLSDVLTATPKKRSAPPPRNEDRLISPHKLKLARRENADATDEVQLLLQVGLLRPGDELACGSCRARLAEGGKVDDVVGGVTHESVEAFAQCQPEEEHEEQGDEELWSERVYVMNVGLTGFSTRFGISIAELAQVAASRQS
jgi:hypothetical protein